MRITAFLLGALLTLLWPAMSLASSQNGLWLAQAGIANIVKMMRTMKSI